jgi:hypothetical protein
MVKRDDNALDTSLGSVRDTSRRSAEPSQNGESDAPTDLREFYYRPEMGSIVVKNDRPRRDDS